MGIFQERIIKIREKWFVETRTGYDGPFCDEREAEKFLNLLKSCDAARCEFAGLEFSPS